MWVMRNTGHRISKARVDGKDSTEATRLKTPFRRETIEEAGTVRLDRMKRNGNSWVYLEERIKGRFCEVSYTCISTEFSLHAHSYRPVYGYTC